MTAQADVGYHARQHARWHWGEIVFWIVVARRAPFVFPSRYLIMTDIVRLGAVCAVARPDPRLCRHRLARPRRVFRRRRLWRGSACAARCHHRARARAGRGGTGRNGARFPHELPGDPRRRPDAADGDARHRTAAGSAGRTLFRHHRRHRRPAGHRDAADPRPLRVRHVRQDRLLLFARGAVPAVPAGAPDRAFAVRPVAARDQQQPAAGGRDRHPRQPAAGRDLHARRVLCRYRRRAVHPDHGARFARRVFVRALRRSDAGAGDRRHRLSLWRADRRGRVPDAAGSFFDHHAAILAILDRPRAGRGRAGRPRSGCIAGCCGCPTSSSRSSPGGRPSWPFRRARRHDDRAGNQRPGKVVRRPARHARSCR